MRRKMLEHISPLISCKFSSKNKTNIPKSALTNAKHKTKQETAPNWSLKLSLLTAIDKLFWVQSDLHLSKLELCLWHPWSFSWNAPKPHQDIHIWKFCCFRPVWGAILCKTIESELHALTHFFWLLWGQIVSTFWPFLEKARHGISA